MHGVHSGSRVTITWLKIVSKHKMHNFCKIYFKIQFHESVRLFVPANTIVR
jgi:hypothetical protein